MCQRNETRTDIVIGDAIFREMPFPSLISSVAMMFCRFFAFYRGSCRPSVLPFTIPVAVLVGILTPCARMLVCRRKIGSTALVMAECISLQYENSRSLYFQGNSLPDLDRSRGPDVCGLPCLLTRDRMAFGNDCPEVSDRP